MLNLTQTSFFDGASIEDVYSDVQTAYLANDYPWVVGYSGGKDSTAVLQIIWYALAKLPPEKRHKPVHVISSDTLVETPVIVDYITDTLRLINQRAKEHGLPFTAQKLTPLLDDTFWVNLIGRGYPAPNSAFRWCTDRMKINPSNRFILGKVSQHGEVVLALGSRRGESMTRDQVISLHRVKGNQLARHGQLPGAWVYMPIEHFTTDDVWTYLMQTKSPWGGDNRKLAALYRSAQSGECPLVVDTTTPSCGNSRFGCWVCTVVSRDRSMEAMIDSGEEWMIPMLEFRDWLSSTQDPEVKPLQREFKSRDGRIKVTDAGKIRYRTYKLEFSKEMLKRLLKAEREVQKHTAEFALISHDELREIRRLWLTERQDWEDALPALYAEVTGHALDWEQDDLRATTGLEAQLLDNLAQDNEVPVKLVQKLLDAEWQNYGLRRRTAIHSSIEKIFGEDWRTWDEVQIEMEQKRQAAQTSE